MNHKPTIKAGVTTKLVVTSYSGKSYDGICRNGRYDEARRIGLLYLILWPAEDQDQAVWTSDHGWHEGQGEAHLDQDQELEPQKVKYYVTSAECPDMMNEKISHAITIGLEHCRLF